MRLHYIVIGNKDGWSSNEGYILYCKPFFKLYMTP